MRCRAVRFARGDGKSAANAATPLQYASAGDSPPYTFNIKHYYVSIESSCLNLGKDE